MLEIIAIGLAGWRLASLLNQEAGPFMVFAVIRSRFGVRHFHDGTPESWPTNVLTSLLMCMWCLTIWTSTAMWGLWQWHSEPVLLMAGWTVAVVAERYINGTSERTNQT